MGLWEALTGRSRPKEANLDALFLVPTAAITLHTAIGLTPTGDGSVCYRAASGAGFAQTQQDAVQLLGTAPNAPSVETSTDSFGYTWLQVRREVVAEGPDVAGLCTDLHAVNTTLEAEGFGAGLLCSTVVFEQPAGPRAALVYLYKKGTFYPFAPSGPHQRDILLELQVRDALAGELPIEPELSAWLALWGAPGL